MLIGSFLFVTIFCCYSTNTVKGDYQKIPSDFSEAALPAPAITDVPFQHGFIRTYSWGKEPTVLFIHGWESRGSRFTSFVKPMLNAGYRIVLMDGHAHGASSGRQTTYLQYGDSLHAVVKWIGEPHAIVAHSYGTAATVTLFDRLEMPCVERVVLVAPVNKLTDIVNMFVSLLSLPDRAVSAMINRLEQMAGRDLETFSMENIAAHRTEMALIVHDTEDRIIPYVNGKAVAAAWSGAQFMTTKGLGHRRILENEAVIRTVVEFLAG
jgi:pimeloyl-ACP methyl ester carboxylesterase